MAKADGAKALTVGIIGFGNIGSGVLRFLAARAAELGERLPRPIVVKAIATRSPGKRQDAPYDPAIVTDRVEAVLEDPEIDVVVELIGGEEPARTFVSLALAAGKHVVTANKALIALHGPELIELAASKGVGLLYEAAVAGGIPIIRTLQQGLAANRLTSVQGILNGTCNYILTRMTKEGLPFDALLKNAQELGYAEPDPTYDIEGYDTAHKIAILASLAFGMDIRFGDVHVEGITQIQPSDIKAARELGYVIKLLGIAQREGEAGAIVRVHPTLVPSDSPLGQVNGVFNSVLVDGDPIGRTMYYGRGAGADPTSSAVVSDLMALAADEAGFAAGRDARLRVKVGEKQLRPMAELHSNYYLRFTMSDKIGVMALVGQALADHGVSIESMIQHARAEGEGDTVQIAIVTHEAQEKTVQAAIARIESTEACLAKTFVLRVEE